MRIIEENQKIVGVLNFLALRRYAEEELKDPSSDEKPLNLDREIVSRPNPVSRSRFHSIYLNLLRSTPDLPPSAPTGSDFDQIQLRANLLIAIEP